MTAKVNRWLFPLKLFLGRMAGLDSSVIQGRFIESNNRSVLHRFSRAFDRSRVLVLLPHCLQFSECGHRIVFRQDNCVRCGRCSVGEVLRLRDEYGFMLAVATGGTFARKVIIEADPDFIIAVACEQDLSLGIYEVADLPVYGILNQRPQGPCVNTDLSVEHLERALKHFTAAPEVLPSSIRGT
ncbi:MAG: DUF116 domain-containing protein [Candidatus Wallbacteria bacterium]|nr:DUF116 domain-containing protein [Candidatus Wallbacteria bacterium]